MVQCLWVKQWREHKAANNYSFDGFLIWLFLLVFFLNVSCVQYFNRFTTFL